MPSQLRRRRAPIDVDGEQDEYYDDYEEEPRESRRGARSRDREDDERPRRSRERSRDRDDDRPTRRGREDRDDARAKVRGREDRPSASRGSGWDTYKDQRSKKAGPASRLQVKDKEVVVHFLQPEPFAIYEQHWQGQRSFTCPDESSCPMCDDGFGSRTIAMFNVTNMDTAENMYIEAGPRLAGKIKAAAEKNSTSPIDREDLYFAINRTKQSNGFFDYELDAIKERDLFEDYKLDPLTDAELDDALSKLFDQSVIPYTDKQTLRAAAEGDDDD